MFAGSLQARGLYANESSRFGPRRLRLTGVRQCHTLACVTPIRKSATFRLDDELHAGMQIVWERDAIQPSEQVRRALRAWLETKGVTIKSAPRRVSARRKA
jgi:hypothetical protein